MTTKTRSLLTALLAGGLVVAGLALPASAQEAKNLGTFNAWTAWTGSDANGLICYISATPQSSEPSGANRDPIHFLIIHRKGLNTKNEVQTLIGYPFNPQANANAAIDGQAYPLVTEGAAAWLASAGDEGTFVGALKKGTSLTVQGTSQRGTVTTDSYSLSGVTAAMNEIDKACS